jgi:hypothetical protein
MSGICTIENSKSKQRHVILSCSLSDGFLLKLCDSALSRDLFPSDYHCLGDNENRPIKWMPIEAIGERKLYSKASDVVCASSE